MRVFFFWDLLKVILQYNKCSETEKVSLVQKVFFLSRERRKEAKVDLKKEERFSQWLLAVLLYIPSLTQSLCKLEIIGERKNKHV